MANGKHPKIRAVLSPLIVLAMALGGVPAPALAGVAKEVVALNEESTANKEVEDVNNTTSVEVLIAQGESAAQGESQSMRAQEADPASTPVSGGETGEPTEEFIDEVEGQTIGVDQGGASNDELLAGYVQRMIDESLPEEARPSAALLQTQSAEDQLSGPELVLYNKLKGLAQGVAAGDPHDAVVTMQFSEFGVGVGPWHASDLEGIDSIDLKDQNSLSAAAGQAFARIVDTGAVINALLADCPYDLYWFDKTMGMGSSYQLGYGSDSDGPYVDFSGYAVTFSMYVAQEYSASETKGTTQTKENILSDVSTAIENAQQVVSDNADKSVKDKLIAYKEAICNDVSYNHNAATNSTTIPYGNPWQLVWVFDGNSDTNVVCEGYSKAFKYLCDLTWTGDDPDVECLLVSGLMNGGTGAGRHMWNIMRMDDGKNYLVDVTNCDGEAGAATVSIGYPDKLFLVPYPAGQGEYCSSYSFVLGSATNPQTISYAYYDTTVASFGEEALTLAAEEYVAPTSLTKVDVPVATSGLVYNGQEQTGVEAGEGYTLSGDATATDAGDHTATATLAEGYEWADGSTDAKTIAWSIARKPVTVTADNKWKVAGEPDPELTATVVGTLGDDTVSYTLSRAPGENPDEYAITPKAAGEQDNYEVTYVAGKLTIGAASYVMASGEWGTCPWELTLDGTLTVHPGTGAEQSGAASPWAAHKSSITSLVFAAEDDEKVILPGSCGRLFYQLSNVTTMDLSGADAYCMRDAESMFADCTSLVSIAGISGWDTHYLASVQYMFSNCSALVLLDLSGWDVSNLNILGNAAFRNCSSLEFIDLSGWNTRGKSVVMDYVWRDFNGCSSLSVFRIGDNYQCNPTTLPSNRAQWWSVKNQTWCSTNQMWYGADTYTSYETVGHTDISNATVTFTPSDCVYGGTFIEPVPNVVVGGKSLTNGTDFVCSYENNKDVGTAAITIEGTGKYGVGYFGTVTSSFEISKAPLTVRAKDRTITYGDAPSNDGVTYEGLLGEDTAASLSGTIQYTYNYNQFDNVDGTFTITPSGLTSSNYQITYASGTLTVNPKPVSLQWAHTSFTYDGESHCPTASAQGAVNGDEVNVTVEGARTNAGTYSATATSLSNSNYSLPSDKTRTFTIAKAAINPTVSLADWTYGEAPNTPSIVGNAGNGDVTFSYGKVGSSVIEYSSEVPVEAGAYMVRALVPETDNYLSGVATAQFSIDKAQSSVATAPEANELTYTGKPQALVSTGVARGGSMCYSVDNKATWSEGVPKATNAGEYKVWYKVIGNANHLNSEVAGPIAVRIAKAVNGLSVDGTTVVGLRGTLDISGLVSGANGEVAYAITDSLEGCTLDEGTGVFKAGDKAGTCKVTVSAAGDANHASATKVLSVTVRPSMGDATIAFQNQADLPCVYDGTAKKPAVTVYHDGSAVAPDDYSIEYLNNVNPGTATVKVTGKRNYTGSKTATFNIVAADVGDATVSAIPAQTYTGSAITPKPKVTLGGRALREGTDYALSYRNNTNAGTATVTVTGRGNYTGSKSVSFKIVARTFPDVPASAWYAGVVSRAVGLGLMSGYVDGRFGPNDKITRGQVAVVLWNMAGGPEAGSGARSFSDVDAKAYFYNAVRWASSKGVVSGYANGRFGPNDNVTREQLAAMLANYAKSVAGRPATGSAADYASMSDCGKVSPWAVSAVGWCFKNKILSGSGGKVNPQGNATRAEAAKMVVGLYDILA